MPVIDASTVIAAISPDESLARARTLIGIALSQGARAPAIFAYEIANVLQVKTRRRFFGEETRDELLAIIADLGIGIEPADSALIAREVVPLAARHALSVYDAAYLELAKRANRPLATLDNRLLEAAGGEGIAIL